MNNEDTVLVGCEVICIGEQSTDLIACPLSREDQSTCQQRRQYQAGMRGVLRFTGKVLDLAEHGDYSNGNEEYGCDEGRVMAGKLLDEYREAYQSLLDEVGQVGE